MPEAIVQSNSDPIAVTTPAQLIQLAAFQGDVDKLASLMDLQMRWEAHEAKKAYVTAMHRFKKEAPEIFKTKKVEFPNSGGGKTSYSHAELDKISKVIEEALLKVGIRHSWRTGEGSSGRTIVTCVLTHELGYSEDVATLGGPPDTSGGKNNVQAIGSTTFYLERYTLCAGTGIVPKGVDDDGKTEGMPENAITDYCIQMQDSSDMEGLQASFKAAYTTAKTCNDQSAQQRLVKVYNERKKDLRQ